MRILVTGGAGFVGTNLIKRLIKEDHTIYSLDNYSTGLKENEIEECIYYTNDIQKISAYDKRFMEDIDVVFHLAADIRVQESFDLPTQYIENNVLGTQYVLEYAKKVGAKVVYAGSASRHTDPYLSPYALSKYMGEELCKMYQKVYNLDVEIARFYNVYGPGEHLDAKEASVIGIWRYNIKNNLPLNIVGDGEQTRDFIHIDDIVEGLYKIGTSSEHHKDAWELGTGKNYSINELFLMFRAKFNTTCNFTPDQKGNVRQSLLENNDSVKKLGWKPSDRLKDYINSL